MTLQIQKKIVYATLAFAALYLLQHYVWHWYQDALAPVPGDFRVYWTMAGRLVRGENIYVPSDSSPFKYSPSFAYLFRYSFFLLPERDAVALWLGISVLTFFAALVSLCRVFLEESANSLYWSLPLALVFSWHGFGETLSYGQVDLLLGAGIVFLYSRLYAKEVVWTPKNKILAIGLWPLLLLVKPHLVLIFAATFFLTPFFYSFSAVAVTIFAYILPIFWLGISNTLALFQSWIHCLREQQDTRFLLGDINQSFAVSLARILGAPSILPWLSLLGILFFFVALVIFGRKIKSGFYFFAYAIAGYLLFSPLSWRWLVFLWIPLFLVGAQSAQKKSILLGLWAILAFLTCKTIGLGETVSFYGFYTGATLCLFLFFFKRLQER